jgi:hypothetical protein
MKILIWTLKSYFYLIYNKKSPSIFTGNYYQSLILISVDRFLRNFTKISGLCHYYMLMLMLITFGLAQGDHNK